MNQSVCAAMLAVSFLSVAPGVVSGGSGALLAAGMPARGSQGYLGVDIRDVSDEQMGVLKLKESRGAEIIRVDHDGPAGKAGLREHDVILQMNGQVIEGEEQLRRILRETPSGRTVTLVISRDGQQQSLTAKMENREEVERLAWQQHMTVPEPNGTSAPPAAQGGGTAAGSDPAPRGGMGFLPGGGPLIGARGGHGFMGTMLGLPYTGAVVEPMGTQLAEFFGVQSGTGLLVRSVEANSPAATAGLRAGDVVVKLNQVAVAGVGDWSKTVHENKGKPVPVTVIREKKEQTLTLTPDAKRRSGVEWPDFGPGFAGIELPDSGLTVAEMRPLMSQAQIDEMRRAGELLMRSPDLTKQMDDLRRQLRELQIESGDLLN